MASRARAISAARRHGGAVVGGRRQLAQEVGAAVVDQEEMRALRVVGAAGGAAGHVEVGLGHDRLRRRAGRSNGRSGMVSPVQPVSAIRTASSSSVSGSRGSLEVQLMRARRDRAAAADAVRAAPPDRLEQRPLEQRVEPGVLASIAPFGHRRAPAPGCRLPATTGRHGANALASRGSTAARSGQWRRIRLVMPLLATQSMPNGE